MASVLEEDRLGPWVFKAGTLDETPAPVVFDQFTAYDVSVKGLTPLILMETSGFLQQIKLEVRLVEFGPL